LWNTHNRTVTVSILRDVRATRRRDRTSLKINTAGAFSLGGMRHPKEWPRWLVPVAVAGFWVLVLVAGQVNPGYVLTRDYISALASRGAEQAWLGVLALVLLPLAHGAVALLLRRGAPVVAAGLAVSVLAGLVVASMRISCPGGAAGCSVAGQVRTTDWMDAVHGKAVAAYGVLMVAVLLSAAVSLWATDRGLAIASGVLGPVSLGLLLATAGGARPGGPQRLWLLVNTGWLVAVALRQGRRR
jgi:Protein of unknown function (DUF998)